MGNEWTDYVQQLVDFAHAFPRFSVMNNKTRPCIPEFLPNIFRVLEGLAGYPTVMDEIRPNKEKNRRNKQIKTTNKHQSTKILSWSYTVFCEIHTEFI